MAACGIVTEFLGHNLPPCDLDGTKEVTATCATGHTRTRIVCLHHAFAFYGAVPTICAPCYDKGVEARMTFEVEDVQPEAAAQ